MANDLDKWANGLAGVGALNWGLVEFFQLNLVTKIGEFIPMDITQIVYGAVGLAGALVLAKVFGLMK